MTPVALAGEYLFDLWNDADHAAKLADMARRAFSAGNHHEALSLLAQVREPSGRLEMRLMDCERQVEGCWRRSVDAQARAVHVFSATPKIGPEGVREPGWAGRCDECGDGPNAQQHRAGDRACMEAISDALDGSGPAPTFHDDDGVEYCDAHGTFQCNACTGLDRSAMPVEPFE